MGWSRFIAIAMLLCINGASARAEASAERFLEMIDGGDATAKIVLNAYENGADWANTDLLDKIGKRFYCKPDRLPQTADQTVEILRNFVEEVPSAAKQPAGLALLFALKYTFPCPIGLGL